MHPASRASHERAPLPFDEPEYETRRRNVLQSMEERGLDLLLVSAPANFFYLTGIYTGLISNYVFMLALFRDGKGIWIGRHTEMSNVRSKAHLTWASETISILDSSDAYESLAHHVTRLVPAGARVGVDYSSFCLSVAGFERLRRTAGSIDFVDASGLIEKHRAFKSPAELCYMRAAGRLSGQAIERALARFSPGQTDTELAATLIESAIRLGSEPMSMGPYVCAGLRTFQAHSSWVNAPIVEGDLINLEIAAVVARYNTPVFRIGVVGRHTDSIRRFADASLAGLEAGLSGIEPGMTSHQADALVRHAINKTGYGEYFTVRAAYGIGIGMQPTWGENSVASLKPNDTTLLQPSMCFHLVPALYKNDLGCVCCSMPIEITDGGVSCLTEIDPALINL